MDGELAQAIALIAHGNVYLQGDGPPAPALQSSNSTFQYVSGVSFLEVARNGEPVRIARDVSGWLTWLGDRGVERLHLRTVPASGPLPDHIAAAFAGGGRWVVEATGGNGAQSWIPRWELGALGEAKQWTVSYLAVPTSEIRTLMPPALPVARENLAQWLTAAQKVAEDLSADYWRDWFTAAIEELASDEPRARYHDDALPRSGYSRAARQVFAGAVGAWVFGGMGSWNDMFVEDADLRRRYEEVSESLYRSMLAAFEAVLEPGQASSG
jgi:hypothetical protein